MESVTLAGFAGHEHGGSAVAFATVRAQLGVRREYSSLENTKQTRRHDRAGTKLCSARHTAGDDDRPSNLSATGS